MKKKKSSTRQVIIAGQSCTVKEFLSIMGYSRRHLVQLRREGLVFRNAGGRPQLLGDDWIAFLATRPAYVPAPRGPGRPRVAKAALKSQLEATIQTAE